MKLREVMTTPPVFVYLETPLWRAARIMGDNNCSFLPVVQNGVPIGVVTMRDLTAAVALEGLCPITTSAADVMTSPAIGLGEDEALQQAIDLMRERSVHRIVISDERGILRGVVSLGDLSSHLSSETIIRTLQLLNEHAGPIRRVYQPWLPTAHAA